MNRHAARILAFSVIVGIWPAFATADIYLSVPNVPGDVTDAGHANTIRAFALDWSITAATSWTRGGGVSVGKPNPGALRLTIATGPWSNVLMQAITTGRVLDGPPVVGPIVIDATLNGRPLYRVTMQGVFLANCEKEIDPQKGPSDVVEMVFKTVSIDHFYVDGTGTLRSNNETWDIPAGTSGPAPSPPPPPVMQTVPSPVLKRIN